MHPVLQAIIIILLLALTVTVIVGSIYLIVSGFEASAASQNVGNSGNPGNAEHETPVESPVEPPEETPVINTQPNGGVEDPRTIEGSGTNEIPSGGDRSTPVKFQQGRIAVTYDFEPNANSYLVVAWHVLFNHDAATSIGIQNKRQEWMNNPTSSNENSLIWYIDAEIRRVWSNLGFVPDSQEFFVGYSQFVLEYPEMEAPYDPTSHTDYDWSFPQEWYPLLDGNRSLVSNRPMQDEIWIHNILTLLLMKHPGIADYERKSDLSSLNGYPDELIFEFFSSYIYEDHRRQTVLQPSTLNQKWKSKISNLTNRQMSVRIFKEILQVCHNIYNRELSACEGPEWDYPAKPEVYPYVCGSLSSANCNVGPMVQQGDKLRPHHLNPTCNWKNKCQIIFQILILYLK